MTVHGMLNHKKYPDVNRYLIGHAKLLKLRLCDVVVPFFLMLLLLGIIVRSADSEGLISSVISPRTKVTTEH